MRAMRGLVVLVGRRLTHGRVVVERHRQRKDEVEDVVHGQRRQVTACTIDK